MLTTGRAATGRTASIRYKPLDVELVTGANNYLLNRRAPGSAEAARLVGDVASDVGAVGPEVLVPGGQVVGADRSDFWRFGVDQLFGTRYFSEEIKGNQALPCRPDQTISSSG